MLANWLPELLDDFDQSRFTPSHNKIAEATKTDE